MAIKSVTPYLMFDGTAEKAIHLYETALGARAEGVTRFGDTPGGGHGETPVDRNRIMNATLHFGSAQIMLSDSMPGKAMSPNSTVQVALDFDDVDDMAKKFEALSEGATVTMPLNDTFWGARFGMLTDAYGIRWMFNCDIKKKS